MMYDLRCNAGGARTIKVISGGIRHKAWNRAPRLTQSKQR